MKKRGQIAVFLIIGLIVIIVAVLIFYLMKTDTLPEDPSLPIIPTQTAPVYNLIEQCMHDVTNKALDDIMNRGGYSRYSQSLYSHPVHSTEGNAVELIPNSDILIPFWYFMKSDNECLTNCEFSTMRKPLCKNSNTFCDFRGSNSIEEELEIYLKNNIDNCLNNFIQIENLGLEIEPLSDPEFNVIVRQNSLLVELDYHVEINDNGEINRLSEYRIQKPTSLYELYEIAYEISKYQEEYCFLDEHMLNVISLHSGINEKLPPFSATSIDPYDIFWMKSNVKSHLEYLTSSYMPLIRLFNTSINPYPEVVRGGNLMQGISDSFLYNPLSKFRNVYPTFLFHQWHNSYFDIFPSKGEVIAPSDLFNPKDNKIFQMMGNFQLREYEFSYRYSFPVIVELRKPRGNNFNDMETFRFALEGNIRSNKCFHSNANIVGIGTNPSLLCDPIFYVNKNYSFTLINDYTNDLISDVEIDYYATETCPIGFTDNQGFIKTRIPSSEQGLLIFSKEGYLDKVIFKDDLQDENIIRLKPLFEKNVSIHLVNETLLNELQSIQNFNSYRLENSNPIKENMSVLLQIERYKENEFDADFSKVLYLDLDNLEGQKLELTKGRYNVDIMLILNQEVNFPQENNIFCIDTSIISFRSTCRKVPKDENCYRPDFCNPWPNNAALDELCFELSDCYKEGFTCSARCNEEAEIIFDEQVMESIIQGGLIINQTNSLWNINDYNLLNNSDRIEFYVFDQGVPDRLTTMINSMDKFHRFSISHGYLLRPYFR